MIGKNKIKIQHNAAEILGYRCDKVEEDKLMIQQAEKMMQNMKGMKQK